MTPELEISKEQLDFLDSMKAEKVNDLVYKFKYNDIDCAGIVTRTSYYEDYLKILPLNCFHKISEVPGQAVYITFKKINELK